jgi:hypothetical protein
MHLVSGDQPMRVLAILALALLLASCQGERIKQGMRAAGVDDNRGR